MGVITVENDEVNVSGIYAKKSPWSNIKRLVTKCLYTLN